MATTERGWRKVADNENDKAQAVNDALDDASADVAALQAQVTASNAIIADLQTRNAALEARVSQIEQAQSSG